MPAFLVGLGEEQRADRVAAAAVPKFPEGTVRPNGSGKTSSAAPAARQESVEVRGHRTRLRVPGELCAGLLVQHLLQAGEGNRVPFNQPALQLSVSERNVFGRGRDEHR